MDVRDLIKEGVALFKNKKFDEAIEKLNQALDGIEDKNNQIQEQNDIQFWLGCCYLEQAIKAKGEAADKLFRQTVEHLQQQLKFTKQLVDEQNSIQEQIYAQTWLGRCYLEYAFKAKGEAVDKLFRQAIKHHQQQFELAAQLDNKQKCIQEQGNAQAFLGQCYFEQAIRTKGEAADKLFEQTIEHRQQQFELAKRLVDKQKRIQEQINVQFWFGRCYFTQALEAKGEVADKLFEQAVDRHQQELKLAKQLVDVQNSIQQQFYAQFWLGRCYREQAVRTKGDAADELFEYAVEHHQQQLELAKQLKHIQEQIDAQSWLGGCYLEWAIKAKEEVADKLFGQAIKHSQQRLELAKQLVTNNRIQQQIDAQAWCVRCYFEQAMKTRGDKIASQPFKRVVKHLQQQLTLTKKLVDKQNRIQQQIIVNFGFGRCYFEQAVFIKEDKDNSEALLKKAARYFLYVLKQLKQLDENPQLFEGISLDGDLHKKIMQRQVYHYLKKIYFLMERWRYYFKWKKQEIQEKLFENKEGDLTNAISTILAVLNIPPIELGSIPLAHYTSPLVCEKLFGIISDKTDDKANDNDPVDSSKVSPMRIGSSTYMNDPTEGEGLLELLNLQDLELENKADCPAYNAFFTCFSSRVNDLNQFRLYGKENGVEASGCCLVFNKSGDWLKEPDVSASFKSFANKQNEGFKEPIEADVAGLEDKNLPLYQVAYIAYYDEYIAKEKCGKWLLNKNNQSFGIRLKPIGKNPSWHQLRIDKLEEALIELMEKSNNISDEDRKILEYIRYLFKDFAFRDEEEFRLLKIEQIGSDKIEYCPTTKSVYLPYADIRDIVDEVILGTNYEKSGKERKAEVFQHLMRKHYPNVKVSRSSLPINANPPIKKD